MRVGSCLPCGPHSAVPDSAINTCAACSPAPTAIASRPSRNCPASSPTATVTDSGSTTCSTDFAVVVPF